MPLLCCSVLALLLLPLSLSCDTKRPPHHVTSDYMIMRTDLDNARDDVTTSLQNSSCPELKHKLRSCTSPNNTDLVGTLHILACKMRHSRLSHTDRLTSLMLSSIRCPCLVKPTKEAIAKLEQRRAATGRRRDEPRRKLCRAKVLLAAVTECYELLNAQESTGT